SDPFEYGPRLVQTAGHDQMPDQQTSPGQPVIIEKERTHLLVHRVYGGTGGVWIVRGLHVYLAPLRRPELDVRHDECNDALEQGEALERVVRARVVHDRQVQAEGCRVADRFDDLRRHVLRCDEVDVMASLGLEPQHHRGDFPRRRSALGCWLDILTDVEVLAED